MQTFVSHISHTNEQKLAKNQFKSINKILINILKSIIYKKNKTMINVAQ